MSERQFAVSGDRALGADALQWVLYKLWVHHKHGPQWRGISFVSSTRTVLERCMREKGCSELQRTILLTGLPQSFEEWSKTRQSSSYEHYEPIAGDQTPRTREIP